MIITLHNFTYAKPATEMESATLSHQVGIYLFLLFLKEIFHNCFTFLGFDLKIISIHILPFWVLWKYLSCLQMVKIFLKKSDQEKLRISQTF